MQSEQGGSLERQLNAVRGIGELLASSIGLESLFNRIMPQVSVLMGAELSTLYLYDEPNNEIWSQALEGNVHKEIRLPVGSGIAGWAAEHGALVNIADAYDDDRFNPSFDKKSGFRTRAVAATPLKTRDGRLLGVLQVINNKRGGPFFAEDIALLETIASQVCHAIENVTLSQKIMDQNAALEEARARAEQRSNDLDLLYQLEQGTAGAKTVEELIEIFLEQTLNQIKSNFGAVLIQNDHFSAGYLAQRQGTTFEVQKIGNIESGPSMDEIINFGQPVVIDGDQQAHPILVQLSEQLSQELGSVIVTPMLHDDSVIGSLLVSGTAPHATVPLTEDDNVLRLMSLIGSQLARSVFLLRNRTARENTERLASVGRMLAGVAHDLRNPMTALSGYAQIMATEEEEEDRAFFSQKITRNIKEMTAMLNDVLAYSRGDVTLKPSLVELKQFAESLYDSLTPLCKPRGIELNIEADHSVGAFDLAKVKRVLLNLGRNAADALSRGGMLFVEIRERDGNLFMQVKDNGPGLPDSVRENLFEPFVEPGHGGGTGLGLSIVKRFVDDHEGTIQVESSSETGTTFTIELPRLEPDD